MSPRDRGGHKFHVGQLVEFRPKQVRQYRQLEVPTKYGNSCRSGMAKRS